MKYLILLGDGMADRPSPILNGKTPLQLAKKPHFDALAQNGVVGTVRTVPHGMPCGSDTANLGVMGYDQTRYYSGRSPLEAVSMGIDMRPDDVAFRCNLVTLSDEEDYAAATMVDYSSDEITTAESTELIRYLDGQLRDEGVRLYPGISYRHCLIVPHAQTGTDCTPPHDILTKGVAEHLPKGRYADLLLRLMKRSRELLRDHPVNRERIRRGLRPATSAWFWGEGTRPALPSFEELFGVRGGVVSAVDLIKGIGVCAGMRVAEVEGATGNIDTNFRGKAEAALQLFEDGCDLVYLHFEAPDECGHRAEAENKIRSIELLDDVLAYVTDGLKARGEEYSVLLLPDHPTPLELRTHTPEPVPFVLWRSDRAGTSPAPCYDEEQAAATGVHIERGCELMKLFVGQNGPAYR